MGVELLDVRKRFGKTEVLHGIDLDVTPGLVTGLVGPSGAGKSTLVNIMVGNSPVTGGTALVLGQKPPLGGKVKKDIGYMPQSEALYDDLTSRENLSFFGTLYGLGKRELREAIPRSLDLVHLEDQGKKLVGAFSGGMKRRLSLAIAFLHSPRLLILDEPTVGLDPLHRIALWESFRNIATSGGALLITTHVMEEAESCDELVMIREGIKIAQGPPASLVESSGTRTLEEAFLSFESRSANGAHHA